MNTFLHPSLPALHHRELVEERQAERHVAAARRQRRARRLNRRAASLARRAATLLDER